MNNKIAVIGLGYVGLPLAVEFGKFFEVLGFDIDSNKVSRLSNNIDPNGEIDSEEIKNSNLIFTSDMEEVKTSNVIVVTVPTPIDSTNTPNLDPLINATTAIAKILQKGQIVVYESTVYPGATEEDCIPILERVSGLIWKKDFFVGYSPERLSPGDKTKTLKLITKVVSGDTEETTKKLVDLYGTIIEAGIYAAQSIKVAEAAKVIENTQRDLNVALMNELSIIFGKLGINTLDVIDAAATKWNFIKMYPGLVGGHCIGVDPYYLTHKAESEGYHPEVILAGRRINDNMGKYIAEQCIKRMVRSNGFIQGATVLILGLSFKENVSDIRNTKVVDIIKELKEYNLNCLISDPYAQQEEVIYEYGLTLTKYSEVADVDAVILATPHSEYCTLNLNDLKNKYKNKIDKHVFIDVKGVFRKHVIPNSYDYFEL